MRLFPKADFRWKEPQAFLSWAAKQERANRRWWIQPLIFIGFFGMGILGWGIGRYNPHNHNPPLSLFVALMSSTLMGVTLAYFEPWLRSKMSPYVTVSKRGIVGSRSNSRMYRFKDLTGFSWLSNPEFSTLILTRRKGPQIFIGVPHDISQEAVSAFIRERLALNQ